MLKVGDKVKLSMPAHRDDWWNEEIGYGEVWVDPMNFYHNKWVVVKEISWETGTFLIEDDVRVWGFPLMSIKEKA